MSGIMRKEINDTKAVKETKRMNLDVLGLFAACSYALDCVEGELVHVTSNHSKRVAYMGVCMAEKMGIQGTELQDLAAYSLLHDNALTQYIQEELHNDISRFDVAERLPDWEPIVRWAKIILLNLPFIPRSLM